MQILRQRRGVTLIVALGVMGILLILGGGIILTISKSLRMTSNVYNSNKAYFAAEAGLEDALYDLTDHTSGYENTPAETTLSNNTRKKYTIKYTYIPNCTDTNDSDWFQIKYKDTYNLDLFIENGSDIKNFKFYVRTPIDPSAATPKARHIANTEKIFLSWTLTAINTTDSSIKYTLIHNDGSALKNTKIQDGSDTVSVAIQNITTGKLLPYEKSDGSIQSEQDNKSITDFFNLTNLSKPKLKISSIAELETNTNKPFPYLEFCIEGTPGTTTLSSPYATITAEGFAAGTKQSIETKVKQDSAISLFDYAVFQ